MFHTTRITFACLSLLTFSMACSKPGPTAGDSTTPGASPAAKRITSESVVRVATQAVQIPVGGTAEAVVRLTIQNGYHVNANPPTFPYLKATELVISPSDGVAVSVVTYPKAIDKQFPFAEKPLAIYEGNAELKATLKADKTAKPGERSIPAQLRIQACDDQVCYPPGTIELKIPASVQLTAAQHL